VVAVLPLDDPHRALIRVRLVAVEDDEEPLAAVRRGLGDLSRFRERDVGGGARPKGRGRGHARRREAEALDAAEEEDPEPGARPDGRVRPNETISAGLSASTQAEASPPRLRGVRPLSQLISPCFVLRPELPSTPALPSLASFERRALSSLSSSSCSARRDCCF